MSLIHWWPLNGDLQDKIQGKIFNNGGWTSASSGKIGTTYNANIGAVLSASLSIPNTFSFACWVKNNDLTYPQAPLPMKFSNGAPYSTASTSNKGWEFSHGNNSKLTLNNGSTAQELNFGTPHASYLGSWYHLVFTVDCHLKKASLFINGELKGEKSFTVTDFSGTYTFSLGQIHGWKLDGFVNDIRIYDHALSQAEVKELSKALVVHYTFNDVLAEPTTNIITGIKSAHGKSSLYGNGVKIDWSAGGADSYFMFNYSQAIKANSVYTLSFDCEGLKSGEVATFALSNLSASSYNIALKNGRNSLTFTAGSDLMNDIATHSRLFFDDKTRTDGAIFYLSNFQLEERDHATPYTPTSREGILVNEAGYSGNGTLYNSSLSIDTASGTLSCHTPRINPNSVNTMVNTTNAAYVYADIFGYNHTPTEFTVAWWWKVIDWGYGTGPFGLVTSNGNYMDSTLGVHDGAVYVNFAGGNTRVSRGFTGGGTGTWTHFALTFKPGSYTSYINGVSQGTATTDASLTLDPWRYVYLGAGCAGGCLRDGDIYWGDFRYYNTCLTDNDIKELYKTKAMISDQGDIMGGAFIEDKTDIQITSKKIVETFEVQELGNSEYTPIEYIASTGSQYIDTKYYWTNEKATIVADLEVTTWKASSTIFGSEERYSGSNRYFAHILHAGSANGSYANYIGQGSVATTTLSLNTRSKIEYIAHGNKTMTTRVTTSSGTTTSANKVSYSGTILTRQNSTQTTDNRGNIYIFSNHNAYNGTDGIQKMAAMKLYRFTMYDNDICVRDFIPCKRNKDGAAGLFDNVTGEFYLSPNNVAFTAGSNISLDTDAKFVSGKTIQARNIIEI
jgi:hypothetical protein